MSTAYKRRRPMLIRTAWDNRRLVALAVALGVMLWVIVANRTEVTVVLPFWLGSFATTSGLAILIGALFGAVVTVLAITILWTVRLRRARTDEPEQRPPAGKSDLADELPPPDYAARTGEGFSGTPYSAR